MNPARRTTTAASTVVVLATAGTLLTALPASAATTCTSPVFKRQFFANTSFSGTPKKTDCDDAIDQTWSGAPVSGLPKDNFGVRYTVTRDFGSGGPFALSASGLDGIRVYVDGVRKIDLWKNTSTTVSKTVNLTIPSGKHSLRVDYVNWTGSARVKFGYTPRTSATVDKVKPLAPTGASASYDNATRKTKLTWAKNKEMDLAGYRVYRRLKGSGSWTKVVTTLASSYTDATPSTGDTYYYEVRAHDKAGNESTGSTDRPITTVDRTAPTVPSGVTAADGQPGIVVTWNAVPGATAYLVNRRWDDDGGDNPVVQVAKVTVTSWLDSTAKEGLRYSYWITAVDDTGNKSAKSAAARIERGDFAPSAPTGLTTATQAGIGVTLAWKPATTPITQDLSRFRIYRNGRKIGEVRSTQTSFTDTGVLQGTAYNYTVTAVDLQQNESTPSAPVQGTAPATGLAPAAVTGLSGVMNGTEIELLWDRSREEEVEYYDIYQGELVNGAWQYERRGRVYQSQPDEPRLLFTRDTYSGDGQTVRWAVTAVDSYGNSRFTSGEDFSYVTVTEPESTE
ncbi:fibronectin type III domain-containing protein [Streptomyces lincolnensis]|uniref:fibronectin type III domain-containing protein n=1 Tax=Streptomyces lincolnensis TaxID=1915 RepID=UPI0037CE65DA